MFTSALIKNLHRMSWDGDPVADMQIACQDRVNVSCELGALIVIHGVGNVLVGTLDLNNLFAHGLVIAATFTQL
jgi:hypothetical protein